MGGSSATSTSMTDDWLDTRTCGERAAPTGTRATRHSLERRRAGERQRPGGLGVREGQGLGVQQQALAGAAGDAASLGVESVTDDWMTDRQQVYAQLVGATRIRPQRQARGVGDRIMACLLYTSRCV